MGLKIIDATPTSISKFIRETNTVEAEHLMNPPKCPTCGQSMKPQMDSKLKRISGFIWRCECMPEGTQMMIL